MISYLSSKFYLANNVEYSSGRNCSMVKYIYCSFRGPKLFPSSTSGGSQTNYNSSSKGFCYPCFCGYLFSYVYTHT